MIKLKFQTLILDIKSQSDRFIRLSKPSVILARLAKLGTNQDVLMISKTTDDKFRLEIKDILIWTLLNEYYY